ncbi:MAG: DUF1285 domain-containing protein [Sphingomonadaceae bacterium]|nr:DUF1285 domain-containing protein [Sphingomonadaceae bacterium]
MATDADDSPIERLRAGAVAAIERPVETWHPAHCGAIDIRIAADGTWWHEGAPMRRPALVRLFASVLRREDDGSYVLVTPGEQLAITVEDVPFLAVEMASEGAGPDRRIAFRLNTDEVIEAGPDHAIELRGDAPYVHVRRGLWARLARPVAFELAELAIGEGGCEITSNGCTFALG